MGAPVNIRQGLAVREDRLLGRWNQQAGMEQLSLVRFLVMDGLCVLGYIWGLHWEL